MEVIMKINGFAKIYDLKKTAIRYYTSVNLLNPKSTGEYLNYDACHDEMKYILKYKDMGFSIDEIASLKESENSMEQGNDDASEKVRSLLIDKIYEIETNIKNEEAQLQDLYKCIEDLN